MFQALMARVLGGFIPMRMNKSGNQSVGSGQTNLQVNTWVADAGYPGTVITSHRLVVSAGSGKTVDAALQWTGTSPWNKSAQVWKNGAQIGTTQSSTGASGTFTWNIPGQSFSDGDTLELRVTTSSTGITIVSSGTYLRVQD